MISELTYRCGYCGLYVSGLIGEVLETMHLHGVWLPRNTGVTCLADWFWCVCGLSFANEVTYGWDEESDSFIDGYYCDCCNRSR